ncbi:MAG: hypothetical protein LBT09_07285 [Planctomycetaceae bacterium]|jgi:DNA repair exonuclease SbcCD ATPase subunit|nr:hypothetical protein [Planctomycetaceae bacterium]
MKRRRNSPQSSLELFLDTICNTFGGILLIAILVAVQIRQTEGNIETTESTSPEEVIALQKKLDQLTADIKLAAALRKTTPPHTPLTSNENENEKYSQQNYDRLVNEKITSTVKKAELTNQFTKQKNENQQLENQIKIIVTNIQTAQNEINNFTQQIKKQQSENLAQKKSNENLQNKINNINQQLTQKENHPESQTVLNTRNETLYLPKLRESTTNQSAYLILRFNRIYDASLRQDFDSQNKDQLGVPKAERGIVIDTSDKSKNEVQKLLQKYDAKKVYVSIIVYGDSADRFYVVRDILIASGFEYDLMPSDEDSNWKFSGNSGSRNIQK